MTRTLISYRFGELNVNDKVSKTSDIKEYVDGIDSI